MTHKNRSLAKLKVKKADCELIYNRSKALHATCAYMQQLFFMHRVVEPYGNDVRKRELKKNMLETILKTSKTCLESRIWGKE